MDQPFPPRLGTNTATWPSQPEGARGSDGGPPLGGQAWLKREGAGKAGCSQARQAAGGARQAVASDPATRLWSTPDLRARRRLGMQHPPGPQRKLKQASPLASRTSKRLPNLQFKPSCL